MINTAATQELEIPEDPAGFDVDLVSGEYGRAKDRDQNPRERSRRHFKRKRAMAHGLVGSIFGYLVLHPIAMAVFAYFEPGKGSGELGFVLSRFIHSFAPGMLPMALVFVTFSAVIGAMDGYYRSLLRFQRDDLAHQLKVNERYRRRLQAQNTVLNDLSLIKRRMTYFLVHDLKNHIGCVLGYSKLLLTQEENAGWSKRDRGALVKISRQATRMAGEVRDILDLAKLEHQPRLHSEPVLVVTILGNAVNAAALGPGEGRVYVDPDVPDDIHVNCNAGMIERVLANLLCNAVKHNGKEIAVQLGASPDGNGTIFSCADTGNGIPDDIKDVMFDEFTSSSSGEGLVPAYGLGLAFCKATVEAHGGKIWFETEQNQGTTFFFSIPTQKPEFSANKKEK